MPRIRTSAEPNERLWRELQGLRADRWASTTFLAQAARVKRPLAAGILASWLIEKHVETRAGSHAGRTTDTWRPARRSAEAPRALRVETDQDRMWRTMKMLKTFTSKDLAIHASVPGGTVGEQAARDYCRHLKLAGYLTAKEGAATARGREPTTFRLVRTSGPRGPRIVALKGVFDPNTGQLAWHSDPAETAHGG